MWTETPKGVSVGPGPVVVSLPFKILLFVLVDGWGLIIGSLVSSFAVQGA